MKVVATGEVQLIFSVETYVEKGNAQLRTKAGKGPGLRFVDTCSRGSFKLIIDMITFQSIAGWGLST